ncbi:aminotransferase class IV [Corynebacterium sp.]|uniref:aminotransferase class IV n=1 Tax=Corynebacterium sp. TaxID=1720 RepID=UPI0026DDBB5C|nr:aminotransferase class IV [Corynebacterium sp.]MDO5032815.1 aminotransferase class IV [Corynebacterium sp.]
MNADTEKVDSFLVRDGRAIRPDLHRARWGSGYPELGPVPETGQWFPRVSASGVEWRPAPPLRTATVLWIGSKEDPRRHPQVKGPDLPALGALRAQAQAHGADDALLHAGGFVREAANAALVFFNGTQPLMAPAEQILESTTVRASVEAGFLPRPLHREISMVEALDLPAFVASALHGWTPVTAWILTGPDGRLHHKAAAPTHTCGAGEAAAGAFDAAATNAALWRQAEKLGG